MTILFISGVNDLSTVDVRADAKGNPVRVQGGNCSIFGPVPLKEEMAGFMFLFGKGVKQPMPRFIKLPSLIFNQIANADTHRGSLERCIELSQKVDVPILNRPEKILETRRDAVAEKLQGIAGVTMPRTIRVQLHSPQDVLKAGKAENLLVPFIVRVAGEHAGFRRILIQDEGEVDRLNVFPLDGRDYYLTEYIDCKDESGLSHLQRIVVIDGEPMLRCAWFDNSWDINERSRSFMLARESWAEDKARGERFDSEVLPGLSKAIAKITNRLELELYFIDCFVRPDGEMVIFQAGAIPEALSNPHPQEGERMNTIHHKIQGMLERHSGEVVI
jgi:glutathione synthase/RimK-type ligase-like ATP-grasp enzyme